MLKTKLVAVVTCALMLLSSGCVEPKTEAKPAVGSERTVATSPLALKPAEKAALRDLATDADPRVQVAVLNAQSLRESEEKFHSLYAKLKPKLDPGRLGKNWETKELSSADFKEACRVLREMAEDLETAHVEFALASDRYEEQLARGPPAYRVAADYFRERSIKTEERVFRDGYDELAVFSERFAKLIEERQKAFARFRVEVTEVHAYAKKSSRYIQDVEGFAASTPSSEGADFRGSHRSFLLVYVRAFNEFLDLTAGFTDSLKARPLPASPADIPQTAGKGFMPGAGTSSDFAFSYRNYPDQSDTEAAIDSAVKKGEAYARVVRGALADHRRIQSQLDLHAGKPLPPSLEAEVADYERRAKAGGTVRYCVLNGDGPFSTNVVSPVPTVGDYLPVIRDDQAKRGGPFFVGVVRVETVTDARITLRTVRGTPQDKDCAVCRAGK